MVARNYHYCLLNNILNKFLDFMKLGEDEDEYDEDFYVDEEESRPVTSVCKNVIKTD